MNQYHWYVVAILVCLGVTDILTEAESKDLENRGDNLAGESKFFTFGRKNRTHLAKPVASGCQAGFTLIGTICYFFSSQTATWDQGLQACRDIGTHLAYPIDAKENTDLENYIRDNFGGVPEAWWIGGTDAANEGVWQWSHNLNAINYTDWCPVTSEPNNIGVENCLSFNSLCDFHWNDRACNYDQFGYICQP